METMWERIKKGIREGAVYSREKVEELTKLGKIKVEEVNAKRKLQRNFIDIGERVFDLVDEGRGAEVNDDLVIKNAVENARALRSELMELEQRKNEVNEEAQNAKEQAKEDIKE